MLFLPALHPYRRFVRVAFDAFLPLGHFFHGGRRLVEGGRVQVHAVRYVPVAEHVKLPAISAAVAMNIFGHGIALSTDYVIQGAPGISAKAANISVESLMKSHFPLIITMTLVTVTVAF